MRRTALLIAGFVALSSTANAGVYFGMPEFAIQLTDISNGAIIHPPGYNGEGGVLEVGICVDPAPPEPPVTISN